MCAASWCAVSGFLLPGGLRALLLGLGTAAFSYPPRSRAVDWCRTTWTEIQVETDERADEMIMNVWPGASRARKRSPNPKDGRARLEAVAAWPEEPRLQRREHYDESQAVEARFYVLWGRAEELDKQGEHRAAAEVWKQSDMLWPAVEVIQGHSQDRFFACLPDDVVTYEKNQDALIDKLGREMCALLQQGKKQAADEIDQRVMQLIEESDARMRKHHERLGNHEGLLGLKDRKARLPPGTTSRLERAYRAPPPTDVGLRKGWKNSIVSLPSAAAATAEDTATAAEAAPEVIIRPIWLSYGTPIALASRLLASASLRTLLLCVASASRLRTRPPRKTSQRRRARSRDSNCYFKYIKYQ